MKTPICYYDKEMCVTLFNFFTANFYPGAETEVPEEMNIARYVAKKEVDFAMRTKNFMHIEKIISNINKFLGADVDIAWKKEFVLDCINVPMNGMDFVQYLKYLNYQLLKGSLIAKRHVEDIKGL